MTLDREEIDIGDCVRILGSAVRGFVVAWCCHLRREDSYTVEYVDADGNPQEREWSESQLQLIEKAKAEAEDWEEYTTDNVVAFGRPN